LEDVMSIKERVKRLEQKVGGSGNFSLIPERERVVAVFGYTREERDAKMVVRLAELHQKYGDFDESCLLLIHSREFRLNGGIVEG
jgi:hypothetical protein